MITVLIADDHDIVREGVKPIVSETRDITVGGEARSGAETIAQVRRGGWDVIILDLNLPDRAGLEVLSQIRSIAPQVPVLIFTCTSRPRTPHNAEIVQYAIEHNLLPKRG